MMSKTQESRATSKPFKGVATRVWVVGVPITSFERSIPFYRDLLGLKVQLDARRFNWMEFGPDEPLCKIGLGEYRQENGGRNPGVSTGITLATDSMKDLHERLTKAGVRFTLPPTKQEWGGLMAVLLDPDGNTLTVVEDPEHYTRT